MQPKHTAGQGHITPIVFFALALPCQSDTRQDVDASATLRRSGRQFSDELVGRRNGVLHVGGGSKHEMLEAGAL